MTSPTEWRSISEAPKDGTPVLLYDSVAGCNVGRWVPREPYDLEWSNWVTSYEGEELPEPTHFLDMALHFWMPSLATPIEEPLP